MKESKRKMMMMVELKKRFERLVEVLNIVQVREDVENFFFCSSYVEAHGAIKNVFDAAAREIGRRKKEERGDDDDDAWSEWQREFLNKVPRSPPKEEEEGGALMGWAKAVYELDSKIGACMHIYIYTQQL